MIRTASMLPVIALLLLAWASVRVQTADPPGCTAYYKAISPQHTMCKYQPKTCIAGVEKIRFGSFTPDEIKEAVDIHNSLRKQLVDGKVAGQPKAVKMREIVWDTELEATAQRLTDQCLGEHETDNSWRALPGPLGVGQNMWGGASSPVDVTESKVNFTAATLSWWNEVVTPGQKPANIKPFVFDSGTGHYSQVAWADTFKIGCGYAFYCNRATDWCNQLVFCNYFPVGNIIGSTMYETV